MVPPDTRNILEGALCNVSLERDGCPQVTPRKVLTIPAVVAKQNKLNPGVVSYAYNSSTLRLGQEGQDF